MSASPESLPPGLLERMDALLAQGNREAVVEMLFRELLGMTDEELNAFKAAPSWPARVAAAHTIPREQSAEFEGAFDRERFSKITAPTLMVSGAESPDWVKTQTELVAATLPNVRTVVLEGQGHVADVLVPEVFAAHLLDFFRA